MIKSLHTSLALVSAGLIAFQILLMQVFSIVQWSHFAAMVISVALLGFGASGTVISLSRDRLTRRAELLVPLLSILSGIAIPLTVRLCQLEGIRFDSYLLFAEYAQIGALTLTYLALLVPFFLGALAIGIIFVRYVARIGSLYFANLVGSGLGGLMAVGLLWVFSPQQATAVIALLPIGAGFAMLPAKRPVRIVLSSLLGLAVVITSFLSPLRLVPSQYKDLSRTLHLPDAQIQLEQNSPYGVVHVISSPALRYAPGLSATYRHAVPRQQAVFNNGDAVGPIMRWSCNDTVHVLDYSTTGLPYASGDRNRILVLGASTGVEVAHAFSRRARRVVAVEQHSVLVSMMRREYARETDSLFYRAEVHVADPRAYLQTDSSTYDLVCLPSIGAFGGTTGLYALREQYLLTQEAFGEMWDRLTPTGVISVTAWVDHPPRNALRIHAAFVEMLVGAGVATPADHIAAVRSWATITYMVKRTPLTHHDTRAIRGFCAERSFDPLLLPDLDPKERARFNQLSDSSLFRLFDGILAPQRDAVVENYAFDVRPPTDDRPYFSQFLRLGSLPRLREAFGTFAVPFLEIGSMVVLVTLAQILVLALILVLLPLVKVVKREDRKGWILVYFGALGLGYLCVEMVLIQRYVLFLGHPLYAAAAVIGGMLMISGVGSYLSTGLPATRATLWKMTMVVALCLLVYGFALTPLLHASLGLPLGPRVAVAILLATVPSLLMGMPFPLGLRYLGDGSNARIAWAWGINGCFSVVSASLALMIAVGAGFAALMVIAAALYGIAALASALQR